MQDRKSKLNLVVLTVLSLLVFLSLVVNTSGIVEVNLRDYYWYDFTKTFSSLFEKSNSLESIFVFILVLFLSSNLFVPIKCFRGYLIAFAFVFFYMACANLYLFIGENTYSFSNLWYLILLIKIFVLSYLLYCFVFVFTRRLKDLSFAEQKVNDTCYLRFSFLIIFVLWLPFFIVYLPGSATFDGLWQVSMGLDLITQTDHHPWPSTKIFSLLADWFDLRGSLFFIFPVTCFIFIVTLALYALCCFYWKRIFNLYFKDNKLIWIVPVLFAIVPIYPNYAQTLIKDGIYSASLCLFFTSYVYLVLSRETKINNVTYLVILLSALISFCFRHNGAYIIIPTLCLTIFIFGFKRKSVKKIVLILCFLTSFQLCYKYIFLPASNIQPGSVVETLSLPSQTLAFVIKKNTRLSGEDEINALKYFTSIKGVRENFRLGISDNIKPFIRLPVSKDHIKSFLKICKKYKDDCALGILAQTYLYFYPGKLSTAMPVVYTYNDSFGSILSVLKKKDGSTEPAPVKYFFSNQLRNIFAYWTEFWTYTFPFSFFMLAAFSSWLIFAFIATLILKRANLEWYLISVVPMLVLVLNLLSPVNGDSRYSLPCISFESTIILLICILIKGQRLTNLYEQKLPIKLET